MSSGLNKIINLGNLGQYEAVPNGTLLLLQVPRTNEKKELAAEQMFAALHGLLILPQTSLLTAQKRYRLSFEIAVQNNHCRL